MRSTAPQPAGAKKRPSQTERQIFSLLGFRFLHRPRQEDRLNLDHKVRLLNIVARVGLREADLDVIGILDRRGGKARFCAEDEAGPMYGIRPASSSSRGIVSNGFAMSTPSA